MTERTRLTMAVLWAIAIVVAAVLDAPAGLATMLPVLAAVTLLPNARRCAAAVRP